MRFQGQEAAEESSSRVLMCGLDELLQMVECSGSSRKVPSDSGRKNSVAREIAFWATIPIDLVVLNDRVWPSSGSQALTRAVLDWCQGPNEIMDMPCVRFEEADRYRLEAFLALALLSFWDFLLIEGNGRRIWLFSHDEVVFLAKVNGDCLLADDEEIGAFFD